MACPLVTGPGRAKELSPRPGGDGDASMRSRKPDRQAWKSQALTSS
jgi:hypothetical protein